MLLLQHQVSQYLFPNTQTLDALYLHGYSMNTLNQMKDETDTIVSSLKALSISDRARFILFGFGARLQAPFNSVAQAFTSQAMSQPHVPAVTHLNQTISFEELHGQATRVALHLRANGAVPGQRVCLLVQRSIAMVIGIMGILMSGASYVPLDGGVVTDDAFHFVLNDSEACLVLCMTDFIHRIPSGISYMVLEELLVHNRGSEMRPSDGLSSDIHQEHDEVYVIYTSGKSQVVLFTHTMVFDRYDRNYWAAKRCQYQ